MPGMWLGAESKRRHMLAESCEHAWGVPVLATSMDALDRELSISVDTWAISWSVRA